MSPALQNEVARLREQAAARFEQLGWPAARAEEWKYTSLAPLQKRLEAGEFVRRDAAPTDAPSSALSLREHALAELVFVDGVFVPEASQVGEIAGLRIFPFTEAPAEVVEKHFARYADYENHPLTALNTA